MALSQTMEDFQKRSAPMTGALQKFSGEVKGLQDTQELEPKSEIEQSETIG
jgi:hypothetical protein